MKKIVVLILMLTLTVGLAACDIIEQEIERAKSLSLEDFEVNVPERRVFLHITSDADEPVIEEVVVNGQNYELIYQGDDWYLLEDVPIAKSYEIGNVYYRTGVGARIAFDIDYAITIHEAMEYIPEESLFTIDGDTEIDGYLLSETDDALVAIESDIRHNIETIDEWVWVILDDEEVPVLVVFEYDEIVYAARVPDDVEDHME